MASLEISQQKHRAFCVAIPVSGKPVKVTGDSPADFIPILKDSTLAWLDFQVEDEAEAERIAIQLGFISSLVPGMLADYYSVYEDLDTELGLKLPAVVGRKFDVKVTPLLILIRKDLIVTIHQKQIKRLARFSRYAPTFMRKMSPDESPENKLTMLLIRIIDENNNGNFDHLREIEAQGDELSKRLLEPTAIRETLAKEIYSMKHALITYLDALWSTLDVTTSLRYGDAELLSDDEHLLSMISILADDVNRQISLSEHMSEVLASGLEVFQSIYNNQLQILNNRMSLITAWLTVLGTAVLVPNTLATVLSNPAFGMTHADVPWYTALLVVSTIISTWISYTWVKKKGMIPSIVD